MKTPLGPAEIKRKGRHKSGKKNNADSISESQNKKQTLNLFPVQIGHLCPNYVGIKLMQVQVPTKSPGHLVRAPSGKTPFNILSSLLGGFGKSLFELRHYHRTFNKMCQKIA